ncbi:MAG: hypothetical protein D6765_04515, partial [Bacteroidetes bacterium]
TTGGLCVGTHSVTVFDSNGCPASETFEVEFNPQPLGLEFTATATTCHDTEEGTLILQVTGGIPSYNLTISGPKSFTFNNDPDGFVILNNLPGGTYTVDIDDSFGQSFSVDVDVPTPGPIEIVSTDIYHVVNGNPGKIVIDPEGGTIPYSYQWSNGSGAQNPSGLEPGVYSLTIVDANGCVAEFENAFEVKVFQVAQVDFNKPFCPDDITGGIAIELSTSDNAPFQFQWFNASGQLVSVSQNLVGVPAGTYTLEVTDRLGLSFTQTFVLESESNLEVEVSIGKFVSCQGNNDGALVAEVLSGQGPFTFEWSNGATTQTNADLAPGVYTVTVTDGLQCSATRTLELPAPQSMSIQVALVDSVSCFGASDGAAIATPIGGVGPFSFAWNDPLGQTSQTAILLPPGRIDVVVTDSRNCSVVGTVEIPEPQELTVSIKTTPFTATEFGTAEAVPIGGTPPYTYEWNFQNSTDKKIIDLLPATYFVKVTDAHGCVATAEAKVVDETTCLEYRSVITPEGDGRNEDFRIQCLERFTPNTLKIYNRWGQLVFEKVNYGNDDLWRGTNQRGEEVPDGVYFFIFEYTDSATQEQGRKKGSITVLRD